MKFSQTKNSKPITTLPYYQSRVEGLSFLPPGLISVIISFKYQYKYSTKHRVPNPMADISIGIKRKIISDTPNQNIKK